MGLLQILKFKKNETKKKERKLEKQKIFTPAVDFSPQKLKKSEKINNKLDNMDKKLDELLEMRHLYEDMLDWIVQIAKTQRHGHVGKESENQGIISTGRDTSTAESILSPRLRQILDVVQTRGEVLASEVSEHTQLSQNRCSEILNALYRANFVEKKRVGREVYYRYDLGKSSRGNKFS